MNAHIEIQLIAAVVAVACALPGVFLVLRKMALMSDAISHALLPGIVLGFFITGNLESPLLLLGAVIMGLITVSLTETLNKTKLVHEDAAIGMVFPFLFSIGVILVSRFAGNVHLDTDAVLLGELAFAPFDRFIVFGHDIGPRSLYSMGAILVANSVLLLLFFKELKLGTFDPGLAAAMGFAPGLIHYGLMLMVSVTAVGAFDSVGSILVVALMIAPASAAYLLTRNLSKMLVVSAGFGVISAVGGYWIAVAMDTNIAGAMAGMNGILFLATFLFAPGQGILAVRRMRRRQKLDFAMQMLSVHLLHHRHEERGDIECHRDHLTDHINWSGAFARVVADRVVRRKLATDTGGVLQLTPEGEQYVRKVMER